MGCKNKDKNKHKRSYISKLGVAQHGATLVVALTVVMVVGILATSVSQEFLTLSRRVENQAQSRQVEAYLIGAESVARQALLQDMQISPSQDYAVDLWAQSLELELPVGLLRACMVDLQGRLNLNALASPDDDGYSSEQRRFIRLLQTLDIENPLGLAQATMLANAVFDWVDPDAEQRFPGGAEDLFYYQQSPAGKAANQPFASVSELRLVRGMSDEIYLALTPHVSLWGNGTVNINSADATLSREKIQGEFNINSRPVPVVLRTLNTEEDLTPLPEDDAMELVNLRINAGGWSNLDFLGQGRFSAINTDGLGVGSEYFNLISAIELGERRYQMQSVLYRYIDALGIPGVRVLSRRMITNPINLEQFCVN